MLRCWLAVNHVLLIFVFLGEKEKEDKLRNFKCCQELNSNFEILLKQNIDQVCFSNVLAFYDLAEFWFVKYLNQRLLSLPVTGFDDILFQKRLEILLNVISYVCHSHVITVIHPSTEWSTHCLKSSNQLSEVVVLHFTSSFLGIQMLQLSFIVKRCLLCMSTVILYFYCVRDY